MAGVAPVNPKFTFTEAPAGSLDVYLAGTTTRTTTWQDSTQLTENENPISLNARGECSIYLDPDLIYKFVLKNAGGVTIWTQDNIKGAGNPGLSSLLSASSGSSLVGFTHSGAGVVARTVQTKLRELRVTPMDFGAERDGSSHPLSDYYATLAEAQADYPHATALTQEIDWAAAQAAADYLGDQGGGTLGMPRSSTGYYVFGDDELLLPDGVIADGEGTVYTTSAGEHITSSAPAGIATKNGYNDTDNSRSVGVRNLKIKITADDARGIVHAAAKRCFVEHVVVVLQGANQRGYHGMAENGGRTYGGNFYNHVQMHVINNGGSAGCWAAELSGILNDGQNNANTYDISQEACEEGIVVGPSLSNKFPRLTTEDNTVGCIRFKSDAVRNVVECVHAEGSGPSNAISVQYTGAQATARMTVANESVTLEAPNGTTVATIDLNAYETVSDLATQIAATSGFTASVVSGSGNKTTTFNLETVSNQDVKTSAYSIQARIPVVVFEDGSAANEVHVKSYTSTMSLIAGNGTDGNNRVIHDNATYSGNATKHQRQRRPGDTGDRMVLGPNGIFVGDGTTDPTTTDSTGRRYSDKEKKLNTVTLTSASPSVTPDLDNGYYVYVQANAGTSGTVTFNLPTNYFADMDVMKVEFINTSGGTLTVAWNASYIRNASLPTSVTNGQRFKVIFSKRSTTWVIDSIWGPA